MILPAGMSATGEKRNEKARTNVTLHERHAETRLQHGDADQTGRAPYASELGMMIHEAFAKFRDSGVHKASSANFYINLCACTNTRGTLS
jgi:hypothetical protein